MAPRENSIQSKHLPSVLKEADDAFQNAIDNVILEHQRLNLPIYISRDGKVVAISADEAASQRKRTHQKRT